jgi:hypothetical protein
LGAGWVQLEQAAALAIASGVAAGGSGACAGDAGGDDVHGCAQTIQKVLMLALPGGALAHSSGGCICFNCSIPRRIFFCV